jgi:septum site-determining protein MinC
LHQAGVTGRDGQAVPAAAPFQIGGRLLTAVVLRLTGDADDAFYAALDARLKQAPQFFAHVPLVLDLDKAAGCEVNFRLLVLEMRTRKLSLVGIQGGTAEQKRAALAAGLISLRGGREPQADGARRNGATAKLPPRAAAMMVTEPVRSGQRIFAEAGDLVVVGAVGSGAEVVASGNIHIYGALRGRALAGATGDAKARIFCHSLDAELVAIAGTYRTNDDIDAAARKQRAQVFLRDDALCIEPLK